MHLCSASIKHNDPVEFISQKPTINLVGRDTMKFTSPSTVVQGWIGKVYSRDDTKLEPQKEEEEKKEEVTEEDDGDGRQQWSNPIEFLLSCISMSVGLGNVWRFPFTAYENGGGAFIIPYIIVLLLIGRPFYLLELGQFIIPYIAFHLLGFTDTG